VYSKETIRTGQSGQADLQFKDNSNFKVGSNSSVHLEKPHLGLQCRSCCGPLFQTKMSKDLLKDQNTIKAWLSMRRSFRED